MPIAAPRQCTYPGCRTLVDKGSRCAAHPYDQNRSRAAVDYNRWYRTARWRKARAAFLAANPLCVDCKARGFVTASSEVDHIVPHKGDIRLFWNPSNWQALCKPCHSAKTARERN